MVAGLTFPADAEREKRSLFHAFFGHPRDFTPVCPTGLGYMVELEPEFEKRDVEVIGLSVDPMDSHHKWAKDIEETQGAAPNYPIGDSDLSIATAHDMLTETAGTTSEVLYEHRARAARVR